MIILDQEKRLTALEKSMVGAAHSDTSIGGVQNITFVISTTQTVWKISVPIANMAS